ncbi:MAG: PAS domain-containing protein [Anaerolineales bacterium]|nr:PAS domain-containing protein [Anaerolineales bacterium]
MARTPSPEILKTLLAPLTDAAVILDPAGQLLHLNPPAERFFGASAAGLIGSPLSVLHHGLGDWFEANRRTRGKSVVTPPPNLDGQPTVTATALTHANGRIWGWMIVIARSERWKAQAIDSVIHDLKNPLHLAGGALIMLREVSPPPDPMQAEYIRLLETGLDRIGKLVERLLAVERVESPTALGEMHPLSLADVFQQAMMRHVHSADSKSVTLLLERAPGEGRVLGDEEWLGSAADNLIENAVKYTQAGGQVRVITRELGGEVICEVSDTGPGIPASDQERLFEPFYRVENAYTRRITGTGLGLAIVRAVIERHGGRLWVSSEPGLGSTFGVALPLVTTATP